MESDIPSKVGEKINARMKQIAQDAFDNQWKDEYIDIPLDENEKTFAGLRESVTFLNDAYVAFFVSSSHYAGGAHGWNEQSALIFDLETGEEASVYDTIDIEKEQIEAYTKDAVQVFLEQFPSDSGLYVFSDVRIFDNFEASLEDASVVLVRDDTGIKAFFGNYISGDYASGVHILQICNEHDAPVSNLSEVDLVVLGKDDASGEEADSADGAEDAEGTPRT